MKIRIIMCFIAVSLVVIFFILINQINTSDHHQIEKNKGPTNRPPIYSITAKPSQILEPTSKVLPTVIIPSVLAKPSEIVEPSLTVQSSETVHPSEKEQPSVNPSETVKPSKSIDPSVTVKASEAVKPSVILKPSEIIKPTITVNSSMLVIETPTSFPSITFVITSTPLVTSKISESIKPTISPVVIPTTAPKVINGYIAKRIENKREIIVNTMVSSNLTIDLWSFENDFEPDFPYITSRTSMSSEYVMKRLTAGDTRFELFCKACSRLNESYRSINGFHTGKFVNESKLLIVGYIYNNGEKVYLNSDEYYEASSAQNILIIED